MNMNINSLKRFFIDNLSFFCLFPLLLSFIIVSCSLPIATCFLFFAHRHLFLAPCPPPLIAGSPFPVPCFFFLAFLLFAALSRLARRPSGASAVLPSGAAQAEGQEAAASALAGRAATQPAPQQYILLCFYGIKKVNGQS
jgi:hypothetical protein